MTPTDTVHADDADELNALLDGELDAARRAALEAHISGCALCLEDLATLRLARTALRDLPLLRAPRPFTVAAGATSGEPAAAIATAAAVSGAPSRWQGLFGWGWRLGSFGAAACVLMAVLSGRGSLPAAGPFATGDLAAKGQVAESQSQPVAPAPNAALANRDAAQRVSPQATPAAGGAGSSAGSSTGLTAAVPADSARSGGAAPPAAAPAQAPVAQPPAPAAGDASVSAPSSPAIPAGGRVSGGFGSGAAIPASAPAVRQAVPPAAPWTAAAVSLGLGSAVLFALDRRARRAV
ncbi:MAG: hypothetical protein AVDCRST_MAG77-3464 [uncultured Chloroflexi bacterium]|uniref:Putative zinc-finger domain-containing protein n=1 Tax=uncultured Chloroflexota bacterium TaxID=166587 RepID=A0A6J4JC94_9CHLR|nr:MAG: hypothetical protein AVDCRST_MAG77-3464 [uncultured Chloroflexota bacterium]